MRTQTRDVHDRKVSEIAARYAEQGYSVRVEPSTGELPFDLGSYRPDLLAEKGDEHFLIEVKTGNNHISVERVRELAEEVGQHPNWRFLLVTAEDLEIGDTPAAAERLLSWQELKEHARTAGQLLELGLSAAALLSSWAVFEGLLRHQAERALLPIERFATSALLKHLYSYGEISMAQFDEAMQALEIRNRVAHGFAADDVEDAAARLMALSHQLLNEWGPRSAAA
ncbi:MAG TPA: restriction endonuclease [Longimicrobium sp.]|jgi:hypothetical protein